MRKNNHIKPSSRCGLNCYKCPAYIATITNNDALRLKTARIWNEKYNKEGRDPITKQNINCLGCLSKIDPVYTHCKECEVRLCAVAKSIENCGECMDYKTCTKITSLHRFIPEGRIVCDAVSQKQ